MLWLLYASLFHWELVYIQMQKTHKLAMIERVGIILKLQLAILKKKCKKIQHMCPKQLIIPLDIKAR